MVTGMLPNERRRANPVLAAIYGALVALVLGYGGSYFLTLLGTGIVSASGRHAEHGPATLQRAGLNLYAMLHATLAGTGQTPDMSGAVRDISSTIVLPLTVWAAVPMLGLIIGGFAAGKLRAGTGRWSMVLPAVLGGVFYAGLLAALAPLSGARVDPSALPSLQGFEFNPPDIIFRATSLSAFYSGLIFGVVFTYVGGLIALRAETSYEPSPGRWWGSAKALVVFVIIIQLIIAVGAEAWFVTRPAAQHDEGPVGSRFAQMLPTAAGMGYLLVNGASIASGIESSSEGLQSPFDMSVSVNLFEGIKRDTEEDVRKLPPYVFILPALFGIMMFFAGGLAVRWGSRDGSLPTALRVMVLNAVYLLFLAWACRIIWASTDKAAGFVSRYEVFITPVFSLTMLWVAVGVFIAAFLGAFVAGRRYTQLARF